MNGGGVLQVIGLVCVNDFFGLQDIDRVYKLGGVFRVYMICFCVLFCFVSFFRKMKICLMLNSVIFNDFVYCNCYRYGLGF